LRKILLGRIDSALCYSREARARLATVARLHSVAEIVSISLPPDIADSLVRHRSVDDGAVDGRTLKSAKGAAIAFSIRFR
jgi:hypothetical protein